MIRAARRVAQGCRRGRRRASCDAVSALPRRPVGTAVPAIHLATSRVTPRGHRPRTTPRREPPSRTATTGAQRSRQPPNERPEVEHPGASVLWLRRSRQGYVVVSGPREGRDQSAPTSEGVWPISSRATLDARACTLLGLATTPPHRTASRPMPSAEGSRRANLAAFWKVAVETAAGFGYPILKM